MPMFTREEMEAWSGGVWRGCPRGACLGVGYDTRRLTPGLLFVALRGARRDGHGYLSEAFRGSAWAALVDEAFAAEPGARDVAGPLLVVPDTRAALASLAAGHRRRLNAEVIGITGSLGKTTVKEMTADILALAGPTARSPASWNNDIGVPLSLLGTDPRDAFGVFEVGMNHPGELAPLCALLKPAWAVLTRIGPVHTEYFDSEEAIADEKATLLRALSPNGTAVLAPDEPWFEILRAAAPGRIVTVAFDVEADYHARVTGDEGIEVREPDGARYPYPLALTGEPARRNALRAIAVGREHGIAPDRIAQALSRFRPLPMRGEETVRRGVRWINDAYNANPVSMTASLEALSARSGGGRRWVVLGGMGELAHPEEQHRALGRGIAHGPWAGVVVVGRLAAPVAEGAREAGFPGDRLHACRDVNEAAAFLSDRLRAGDLVLMKGSRSEGIERVERLWEALGTEGRI